jgi:hypothetical protein
MDYLFFFNAFIFTKLIDMSGGVAENLDLLKMDENEKKNLWNVLFQAHNRSSIIGCCITVSFILKLYGFL